MRPTTLRTAICFTWSSNSNGSFTQIPLHRHTQYNIWPNIWVSHDPVRLTHKINRRIMSVTELGFGSRQLGSKACTFSLYLPLSWRRKWQPTPVFLPGESQGWGSLVGCCLWVTQSGIRLKWLSSSSKLTIQLSHPLSSPSPSAFYLSQHQGLFQ